MRYNILRYTYLILSYSINRFKGYFKSKLEVSLNILEFLFL